MKRIKFVVVAAATAITLMAASISPASAAEDRWNDLGRFYSTFYPIHPDEGAEEYPIVYSVRDVAGPQLGDLTSDLATREIDIGSYADFICPECDDDVEWED